MEYRIQIVPILASLFIMSSLAEDESFDYSSHYKRPPPAILMHKQALRQDGAFNYVFAAENGMKQGETIAPDGTRMGAYSYVDPNGQTISVKYSAGKDGFKIIEGDHIPKPPAHVAAQPTPQPYQQYQPYQPARSSYSSEEMDPVPLHRQNEPSGYSGPTYNDQRSAIPIHERAEVNYRVPIPRQSNVNQYVPGPEDEHKGPHSFGKGYSFEFTG